MKLSRFLKEYFRKYVNVFGENLRKYANLLKKFRCGMLLHTLECTHTIKTALFRNRAV